MKENYGNSNLIRRICICLYYQAILTYLRKQRLLQWDNWEDICYCTMNNSYHPSSIVSADNNLQLLISLKNGLTRKQLDSL
jgi:hypothetical protein